MPREPKTVATVEKATGPNGLVASAIRLSQRKDGKTKKVAKAPAWYLRAWDYFDTIGEYRYAVTWVGNLLSRATLEVWEDGKPTENAAAKEALEALFGGEEGQREMLRQLGTHLTVTGDSYIFGLDRGTDPDEWEVVAANRVSKTGEGENAVWKIDREEQKDALVIRLWRPHPFNGKHADSPTRAVLNVLDEIEGFTKHVKAQIASRLTGAGVLAIPSEITFGTVRGMLTEAGADQAAVASSGVDAFLREFIETVSIATTDQADASARVPIILQGPGEFLDKVKHITFWSELDAQAKELRDEAIRRLALGMDMPPEILTGTGEMNHWNSWQVEEASIKAHTEPLLNIITTSLAKAYLRPYLESEEGGGMSEEDARRYTFHANTAKIRLRPNRSKEAIELYNLGELSAEAMLRENGFDPADAMGDDERKMWLTKKVAGGSTTPELVAWALSLMGVDIPQEALQQATPTEAPSDPSLLEHPTRDLPERNDDIAASAHVVVFRALERAGARLKSKYKARLVPGAENVPNEKVYRYAHITEDIVDDLLMGAWDCLNTLGIKTSPIALDRYTRSVLLTSDEFTSAHFKAKMETV